MCSFLEIFFRKRRQMLECVLNFDRILVFQEIVTKDHPETGNGVLLPNVHGISSDS